MRRLITALLPCLAMGLAGAVLSTPVAATDAGKITFVQGRPGLRVDVCVGTREIVSALPYGGHAARLLGIGARHVWFLKASDGRCDGDRIVGSYQMVTPGSDTTVVLTRDVPRVVVFPDNLDYAPEPGSSRLVVRNASDLGLVSVRYTLDAGTVWHPTPTVDDGFEKGDWGGGNWPAGVTSIWWVERLPDLAAVAGPVRLTTSADTRHESILIGTKLRNARLVRLDAAY